MIDMKNKPDSLVYLIALVGLIIAGAVTTAIINSVKNNQSAPADIRARAGVVNIVKLTGTVTDTSNADSTITVANVEIAPESRSGPAVNYGSWKVTPPLSVSISSIAPGQTVNFVVDAASFDVATHKVVASELTIVK